MSDSYTVVLLFGAPGVGKGTQGKLLGQIPGFAHLATGDIFRSLDPTSPSGQKFLEYSSKGELVPDELTVQLWKEHVEKLIANGCYRPTADLLVMDGIPRNVNQVAAIAPYVTVERIIHLHAADIDDMVKRMKRRAEQQGRHDDADESVIRKRFDVYENETSPVLQQYDKALVSEINAIGTPASVLLKILKELVPVYEAKFSNPLEG